MSSKSHPKRVASKKPQIPWPMPGGFKGLVAALTERAHELAKGMGYEVVGVTTQGSRVVTVALDFPYEGLGPQKAGSGVGVEDCARFSRALSAALERDFPEESPLWYLEVSSPGLDRPLFSEEDFRRFAGNLAKIRLELPDGGTRVVTGILRHQEGIFSILPREKSAPPPKHRKNPRPQNLQLKNVGDPLPPFIGGTDLREPQEIRFQVSEVRRAKLVPDLNFEDLPLKESP